MPSNTNKSNCKLLVNVFINKIYLYDDNVTIFFNTQDKEYKSKVPTIEEAEVRIKDKTAHQINNYIK